ncbi:hypothetical protein SAMN02799643_03516 [Methylobacterium sp. UNCCL125]|nr:hypothetical protein SAMN02799643_03516 [Methylobacterium sp. UNCCL125]
MNLPGPGIGAASIGLASHGPDVGLRIGFEVGLWLTFGAGGLMDLGFGRRRSCDASQPAFWFYHAARPYRRSRRDWSRPDHHRPASGRFSPLSELRSTLVSGPQPRHAHPVGSASCRETRRHRDPRPPLPLRRVGLSGQDPRRAARVGSCRRLRSAQGPAGRHRASSRPRPISPVADLGRLRVSRRKDPSRIFRTPACPQPIRRVRTSSAGTVRGAKAQMRPHGSEHAILQHA